MDDGKRQQNVEWRGQAQSDDVFSCPIAAGHETRL